MTIQSTTNPIKISPQEKAHRYFLAASHCNAQKELSLSLFAQQLIDVAVQHANSLNIGYARLKSIGALWVLSRITVAMHRMPHIEENYTIVTWIESFQRMFSHRNFVIYADNGEQLGFARTLWVAIDEQTRRPADLSGLISDEDILSERDCPIPVPAKLRDFKEAPDMEHYRFQATDIDFNRHVNSTRYIELILNQWSLEFHDRYKIVYFDINYRNEAHFGERVTICLQRDESSAKIKIEGESHCVCMSEIRFAERGI